MANLQLGTFLRSNSTDPLPWRPSGDGAISSVMPAGEGAAGLWLGERADSGDQVVIVDRGTSGLKVLVVVETGSGLTLKANDELVLRLREVFTGDETVIRNKLGQSVPAGTVTRMNAVIDPTGLKSGYYLAIADITRDGRSLLGGRVGCDDFYIRERDESMTYTVLSVRTGMALWCRDLIHGDIMGDTNIALPHVYDPLNNETYPKFLRLFVPNTGKCTEGNETGVTGLVLAAEAFRKTGDLARCKFVEWLIKDSVDRSIVAMQSPAGGVRIFVNELADEGIGRGRPSDSWDTCDTNHVGELMRAWVYAMLYFHSVPGGKDYAKQLSIVCRKSADYLVAHSTQESDGLPKVIRHLTLAVKEDGTIEDRQTFYQEGRQCDVYMPRALAGLSYYAYAMQVLGEKVPDPWWEVLDNSVEWCRRKMKPNGWFDWQCEDIVEGGCHTFLGNIYEGEGIFGVYMADRLAGRNKQAEAIKEVLQRAYRYVTDACMIRGIKFKDYFGATDLWVAGYVYWLFTEYLDTVGEDEALADWLKMLDHHFRVVRGWQDLLDRPILEHDWWKELWNRPYTKDDYAYRAEGNGMLALAILGYPAIKHMEEIGRPFQLPFDVSRNAD
jgi:hypothetical protein